MPAIPSLPNIFPELWIQVEQLAHELKTEVHANWTPLFVRLEFLSDPDIVGSLNDRTPGWQKIASIRSGITAKHTILVLAICLNLPEYKEQTQQTQLEIQWAALFHDIDKDGSEVRDTTHPFRSAAIAAKAMHMLGFDSQAVPGDIETWAALARSAQREVDGQAVHDHARLREIVEGIHRQWGRETSASRILKAVLFHQSLPTLKDWINPVLLNDEELQAYLTADDMNILAPLLIADSDSWNIFDNARFAYLNELRMNIAETRRRLSG